MRVVDFGMGEIVLECECRLERETLKAMGPWGVLVEVGTFEEPTGRLIILSGQGREKPADEKAPDEPSTVQPIKGFSEHPLAVPGVRVVSAPEPQAQESTVAVEDDPS